MFPIFLWAHYKEDNSPAYPYPPTKIKVFHKDRGNLQFCSSCFLLSDPDERPLGRGGVVQRRSLLSPYI